MSTFGADLIQSLTEAVAHAKGEGRAIVHAPAVGTEHPELRHRGRRVNPSGPVAHPALFLWHKTGPAEYSAGLAAFVSFKQFIGLGQHRIQVNSTPFSNFFLSSDEEPEYLPL